MPDQTIDITTHYPLPPVSWGQTIYLQGYDDHDCYVYKINGRYSCSCVIVPRKPTLWQKLISTLKGLFQ